MKKIRLKLIELVRNIYGAWLTFKFLLYLRDVKAFSNENPALVLRIIQRYLELAVLTYHDNSFEMGRTINQSSLLLSALIDKWFRDKSSNSLEQILEVLKNEFIRRKNG